MDILAKIFGKRFLYGILISVLFLLTVILMFALLSRDPEGAQAQKAFFYPETCLGGWKSARNASGVPEALEDLDYDSTNSAVFKDGDAAIFCGEFRGELPPQTYQTRVTLRFSWQQEVIEPLVTEEPNLLDVIVDIFDHEEELEGGEGGQVETSDGQNATTTDEVSEEVATSTEVIDVDLSTTTDTNSGSGSEPVAEDIVSEGDGSESPGSEAEVTQDGEVVEEVEEVSEPEPKPEPAPVSEPSGDPVSWWRVFANTVYAEELATTTTIEEVVEEELVEATTTDLTIATSSLVTEDPITPTPLIIDDEVEVLPEESVEAIFAVEYTLDGQVWQNIGYVTTVDNDVRFELPKEALVTIEDVNQVQIALRPLLRFDNMPEIYLDSMWFEISYAPIRELGVHALSSLAPEEIGFDEFFNATGTIGASSTINRLSAEQFLASTTFIHGLDSRYSIAGVPQGDVTELWLLDVDLREIKRIGFNEASIGTYPLGAKERMIFWLNYDASIIFTYDLRTGGSLHEMALVGNLPEDEERRFTFPFTDWQVVWRANEMYFYKDSPGEVFKDENSKAADRLRNYLQGIIEANLLLQSLADTVATTTLDGPDTATTTETNTENENI